MFMIFLLFFYIGDNLRINSFKERENYGNQGNNYEGQQNNSNDPLHINNGPMIRAKPKTMKKV